MSWMLCIALVFLAAVVVASDNGAEVVDLGRLGENTGRRGKASTIRRGGSFLSTEGSFTVSHGRFQGNNEEDELGERDASSEDAYGQTDIDELGDSEEHEQADELGYSNQLGEELTVRDHAREKKFSAEGLSSVKALLARTALPKIKQLQGTVKELKAKLASIGSKNTKKPFKAVKLKPGSAALKAWRVRGGDSLNARVRVAMPCAPFVTLKAAPCHAKSPEGETPRGGGIPNFMQVTAGQKMETICSCTQTATESIVFVSLEATPDGTKSSGLMYFSSVSMERKKTRCALTALFGLPRVLWAKWTRHAHVLSLILML